MVASKIENKIVGILVFEQVEILDFAGPMEVFAAADEISGNKLWDVKLISTSEKKLTARFGLNIISDYELSSSPRPDVLIIPGGKGIRNLLANENLLLKLKSFITQIPEIITVCTGSLLAGKLSFLDDKFATTHHENLSELKEIAPKTKVVNKRFCDNGNILCAEGVSAGIDVSLYYIQREAGDELAEQTANYMMYKGEWKNNLRK